MNWPAHANRNTTSSTGSDSLKPKKDSDFGKAVKALTAEKGRE